MSKRAVGGMAEVEKKIKKGIPPPPRSCVEMSRELWGKSVPVRALRMQIRAKIYIEGLGKAVSFFSKAGAEDITKLAPERSLLWSKLRILSWGLTLVMSSLDNIILSDWLGSKHQLTNELWWWPEKTCRDVEPEDFKWILRVNSVLKNRSGWVRKL